MWILNCSPLLILPVRGSLPQICASSRATISRWGSYTLFFMMMPPLPRWNCAWRTRMLSRYLNLSLTCGRLCKHIDCKIFAHHFLLCRTMQSSSKPSVGDVCKTKMCMETFAIQDIPLWNQATFQKVFSRCIIAYGFSTTASYFMEGYRWLKFKFICIE